MILAGDIGGTNTRVAIFDESLALIREKTFRNEGRGGLREVVAEFLQGESPKITRACFGVAGPVKNGAAVMTNLPWKLDQRELSRELKIEKLALINDLVAHGEGVELLKPEQLITINAGQETRGHRVVIAAGTGLGEGGIFWDALAGRYHAFPSEGGHADFAPRGDRQIALLKFLQGKYPNASWERVLSGPGLRNIYDFLISSDQLSAGAALPVKDPKPAAITQAALQGENRACVEALDLFIACYGAESANLALKILAIGGVFIGGGIAPKIASKMTSDLFRNAFFSTGPENLRTVLRNVPVHIINFELNGLYGAANYARSL